MKMKNKLYKHHKSKLGILSKKTAVVFSSILGAFLLISVPTYISILSVNETPTNATQENEKNENEFENNKIKSLQEF